VPSPISETSDFSKDDPQGAETAYKTSCSDRPKIWPPVTSDSLVSTNIWVSFDLAKLEASTAITLDASSPLAHLNLGDIDFMLGRYGDTIREYKRLLEMSDQTYRAYSHYGLGTVYLYYQCIEDSSC